MNLKKFRNITAKLKKGQYINVGVQEEDGTWCYCLDGEFIKVENDTIFLDVSERKGTHYKCVRFIEPKGVNHWLEKKNWEYYKQDHHIRDRGDGDGGQGWTWVGAG